MEEGVLKRETVGRFAVRALLRVSRSEVLKKNTHQLMDVKRIMAMEKSWGTNEMFSDRCSPTCVPSPGCSSSPESGSDGLACPGFLVSDESIGW